jgi:hypothetical protein
MPTVQLRDTVTDDRGPFSGFAACPRQERYLGSMQSHASTSAFALHQLGDPCCHEGIRVVHEDVVAREDEVGGRRDRPQLLVAA